MATLIKLKKGYDLKLQGGIVSDEVTPASKSALYAVIPDDFTGIVPRMEVKEGDNVAAGDVLYHDKNYESLLEGEITETGAGIVLRKKMLHLRELFIFKKNKPKPVTDDKQTEEKK